MDAASAFEIPPAPPVETCVEAPPLEPVYVPPTVNLTPSQPTNNNDGDSDSDSGSDSDRRRELSSSSDSSDSDSSDDNAQPVYVAQAVVAPEPASPRLVCTTMPGEGNGKSLAYQASYSIYDKTMYLTNLFVCANLKNRPDYG